MNKVILGVLAVLFIVVAWLLSFDADDPADLTQSEPASKLELDTALQAIYQGTRFNEVSVEIQNCKIIIERIDPSICSQTATGTRAIEDIIDVSQLKYFVPAPSTNNTDRALIQAEYTSTANQRMLAASDQYDLFVKEQVEKAGDDKPVYTIDPFFEEQSVASLPAFRTSDICDAGHSLTLNPEYHPLWVPPAQLEDALAQLNELIENCKN